MCGIVGMAGDFNYQAKALFEDMLRVCSLRGKHSTGAAAINTRAGSYSIAKEIGEPVYLFETKAWDKISTFTNNVLIGHCRHTTRGTTSRANAHPFVYGSIIGCHNGTLTNDRDLAKEVDDDFNTDSQAMFAHIAKFGVDNTIPKTKGAYAIVFYDFETKQLNMIRNSERPLWYCFSKDVNKIFWASEYWMLQSQLSRNNVDVWRNDKGDGFFSLPVNTLLKFQIPETGAGVVKLVAEYELKGDETKSQVNSPFRPLVPDSTPSTGPVILGTPPIVTQDKPRLSDEEFKAKLKAGVAKLLGPDDTESQEGSGTTSNSSTSSNPTSSSKKESKTLRSMLTLVPSSKKENSEDSLILGRNGEYISEEEFKSRVSNGCIWCSSTIYPNEHEEILWIGHNEALCPGCSNRGSEARRYIV